jgi:hypothetical protein
MQRSESFGQSLLLVRTERDDVFDIVKRHADADQLILPSDSKVSAQDIRLGKYLEAACYRSPHGSLQQLKKAARVLCFSSSCV